MTKLQANHGKRLAIEIGRRTYARIPVGTHVISKDDDIVEVVLKYAGPALREGDIMVVSEKIVAITQERAYPISQIKPSWLARFLAGFVCKSPYGIGLGSPCTMELAIREAGVFRIIAAAIAAGVAKLFGISGVFYRICGPGAAAIDGPCDYTLPPYNRYAILGPLKPNEVAQSLSEATGVPAAIVDANDLGVSVLGVSSGGPEPKFIAEVLADNPLGQSCEQTPIGIVRPIRRIRVHPSASVTRRNTARPLTSSGKIRILTTDIVMCTFGLTRWGVAQMGMPSLGDQELELLQFLTEHSPMTVREAYEDYGKDKGLARTTILTMMERLRTKGYLTRSEGEGANEYSARLTRSALMRGVVRDFVEKTLGGTLSPFVAYIAEDASVDPQELEELKRLVDELELREDEK